MYMNTKAIPTLPVQADVDLFLTELFQCNQETCYYLTALTDSVKDFFSVSTADASVTPERSHGCTSPTTTYLEQLAHWGCVHLLKNGTIKRTGPNEYQHAKGQHINFIASKDRNPVSVIATAYDEALAFFKHARKLEFTISQAKDMVADKWTADIRDKAATVAFS